MKFIFHNPNDLIWYKSPFNLKFKKTGPQKYVHILDWFLKKNEPIYVYLDKPNYYLSKNKYLEYFKNLLLFYGWVILNRLNIFKFRILKSENIKKEDVLFMFAYGNFTDYTNILSSLRNDLNSMISELECYKVVHLTHYMYMSSLTSLNAKSIGVDLFVAENNLYRNSEFFKKMFPWYKKDVYHLPFVPKERFNLKNDFFNRINLAVATGTITLPIEDKDFLSFFESSQLHPMRQLIYDNRDSSSKYIESYISPIIEDSNNVSNLSQNKYFSFDIVEVYNKYKMFIVPEEISGLPGIGFVEGMACGSVFIGLNDPMYKDIGLIDGLNYVSYDGSYENLLERIKYYQENTIELEAISKNSLVFVENYLNKEFVVEKFVNYVFDLSLNKIKKFKK